LAQATSHRKLHFILFTANPSSPICELADENYFFLPRSEVILARSMGVMSCYALLAKYLYHIGEEKLPPPSEDEIYKNMISVSARHFPSIMGHHTFLGAGPSFPIAMEGALKVKEASFLDANADDPWNFTHGPDFLSRAGKNRAIVSLLGRDDNLVER